MRPIIPSPQPYGYRNRIVVHREGSRVGFRSVDGRKLVDIWKCLIASDEINRMLARLRVRKPSGEHYSIRGRGVAPAGFYQANAFMLEHLRQAVAAAVDNDLSAWIECHAGCGFFTETLHVKAREWISIEFSPTSARLAQRRIPSSVRILEGSAADLLPQAWEELQDKTNAGCLLDPPRQGLDKETITRLMELGFRRIVYLSCDPATLARDIERLSSRWRPDWIEPIDLFPRTGHIEILTRLSLLS
jgi:23S rRNA (uracil1939-C5)-methyltransferase